MVFNKDAMPLMEKFMAANEFEGVAIKRMLAHLQHDGRDDKLDLELTTQMTEAHNKKMTIWQELQQFRIG